MRVRFSGMYSLESRDDNRDGRPTVKKSMTDEGARGIIAEDQYFRMKRRIEPSNISSVT